VELNRLPHRPRTGFTLIELVVVLMIVAALAGLVLPVIAGMVARTHNAKCSSVIRELNSAMARSFAMSYRFQHRWLNLVHQKSRRPDGFR
jgi:prepilin-type N-terminal cleavage/methylation domain-containing protein